MNTGPSPSTVEAARKRLWEGVRLVVVDTETTGLSDTARIISIAVFVLEDGTTTSSWSTLVNPGLTTIGASDIHGLTAAKLRNAPSFGQVAATVRELLTSRDGESVFLVGHNINFDYRRLDYEFFLLDDDLGAVVLLDTKSLARAAGVASANRTLEQLGADFGLSNPSAHEAAADALLTREIALRSIERLAELGTTDLRAFAQDGYRGRFPDEPEEELSDEHVAFHAADMLTPASRDDALRGCLTLSCPKLHRRINDAVVDAKSARQLAAWAAREWEDDALTRYQRGLLAAAFAKVLRTWREMLAKPSASTFTNRAVAFLSAHDWEECDDEADLCDLCARAARNDDETRRCRFVATPAALARVCLYSNDGEVTVAHCLAFCFGSDGTVLGTTSGYAKFANVAPAAALDGAVTAGRTLRSGGDHDDAMIVAQALWNAGEGSAGLTNLLAALTEDTGRRDKDVLEQAVAICAEGRARGGGGNWASVDGRGARLRRRIAHQEKPPPLTRVNTRAARRKRFT